MSQSVRSFVRSFVASFVRSFVRSFFCSFGPPFLRSFVPAFLCRLFVRSFIRWFVRSLFVLFDVLLSFVVCLEVGRRCFVASPLEQLSSFLSFFLSFFRLHSVSSCTCSYQPPLPHAQPQPHTRTHTHTHTHTLHFDPPSHASRRVHFFKRARCMHVSTRRGRSELLQLQGRVEWSFVARSVCVRTRA